jgi:cystathionine beta-lyase
MKPSTKLIHFAENTDQYGANSTPIYQTSTFAQQLADENGEFDYTRSGNPTRKTLEKQLASIDNAEYSFAFSSGMAAIAAVLRLFKGGEEVIASSDLYGGTFRYFTKVLENSNINLKLVNTANLEEITNNITEKTRLLWIETPSNPKQDITNIKKLAEITKHQNTTLVVDNSLLSSWIQKPLELGADIVVQSATKHYSGHSDVTAGVVSTNSKKFGEQLAFNQNTEGTGLAPFECWLLLRGIQTLDLRLERQQSNTLKIAQFLKSRPEVTKIYTPALTCHPGHVVHHEQASGPGTVISFETGSEELSKYIVEKTKLFTISVSFGSTKSLISLPCYMSHASIPKEQRKLPSDLVRISTGIEDADDLISDLNSAFDQYAL